MNNLQPNTHLQSYLPNLFFQDISLGRVIITSHYHKSFISHDTIPLTLNIIIINKFVFVYNLFFHGESTITIVYLGVYTYVYKMIDSL